MVYLSLFSNIPGRHSSEGKGESFPLLLVSPEHGHVVPEERVPLCLQHQTGLREVVLGHEGRNSLHSRQLHPGLGIAANSINFVKESDTVLQFKPNVGNAQPIIFIDSKRMTV